MSLFGGPSATQNTPNLFGSLNTGGSQPQQQQSSNNLLGFGSSQQQNNNNTMQSTQQHSTPSLFGTSGATQQQSNSLFGANTQQPPQQSSSLFGNSSTQQQPTPLFGASIQQANPPSFGGSIQPSQQQQQNSGGFPFGGSSQQPQQFGGISTFGASQQQPQQLQLGQSLAQSNRPPLWQTGTGQNPREKTIPDQMQTLLEKWSPDSNNCVFQHYFYNSVPPAAAPYYVPVAGEDEQKWEEALAKKPSESSVPVLCRGFAALGSRLQIQVQSANALQARLHEINGSLTMMLQEHDLNISVRAVDARRRHLALSQRCLQLAAKVQILRNRGYAMDSTEETLKTKLVELERTCFDPQLSGRQEEIWARLVWIRERARFLLEEMEKAGTSTQDSPGNSIDEDVIRRTKKILGDYDSQISHLQKEIEAITKDFTVWAPTKTA